MAKIFIVEDNNELNRMYARAFALNGHEVLTAEDGEDALNQLMAMSIPPDIILLDAMLPKLDGMSLLIRIRAEHALMKIPVIILTNSIREDARSQYLDRGANGFLIKMNTDVEEVVRQAMALVTPTAHA